MTSVLELDELLAAVVESIQSKFGYYFIGVWLLNPANNKAPQGQSRGLWSPSSILPLE